MSKSSIPLHKDELKAIGIEIKPLGNLKEMIGVVHRDDYYMFIVQSRGNFLLELDFRRVKLSGASLCFIAPGQVHSYLSLKSGAGWFVFLKPALVSKDYAEVFNTYLNSHQVIELSKNNPVFSFIPILEAVLSEEKSVFRQPIIQSMTDSLVGMVANTLVKTRKAEDLIGSQKYQQVIHFKQLVLAHYKQSKQVKEYARMMNITPLYLNEMVKEVTGFSASHWIIQEIVLEAQRLLYYTELDVKQIAYELGYEDHAYFSRFFKKNTGMSASEFRNKKPLFVQL